MGFTKIDNDIIMEVTKQANPSDIVLYAAILSKKRDGMPLPYTASGLSRLSSIFRKGIAKGLSRLQALDLIKYDKKEITWTAHSSSVETKFTPISNDFIAQDIPPTAKLLFIKVRSLPQDKGAVISQEKLMQILHCCRDTVKVNAELLKDMGLIEIGEREGFKAVYRYKVTDTLDIGAVISEKAKAKQEKAAKEWAELEERIVKGGSFTAKELFQYGKGLIEQKGEIYNQNNSGKDIGVFNGLLKVVDSNTLAKMISKFVEAFKSRFQSSSRQTIKLSYLGADDVFYRVKVYVDYDKEEAEEQMLKASCIEDSREYETF